MQLSVIIPVYKSQMTIRPLVEKLQEELKRIAFEVVLVNDGSPDNSETICISLAEQYKNVKLISLRRNFGEFNAVMAGLHFAEGNFSVMIDDDFQNPPSEILKLLETAQANDYDVVYGQYLDKKHSLFRNFGSSIVNKMNNYLLEKPKDLYLSSFKLIKREVVQEIIKYNGPNPYLDALLFRVTNHVGKVIVEHNEREDGHSTYSPRKLVSLFLTTMFGFSVKPIRLFWIIGVLISSLGFVVWFISVFYENADYQKFTTFFFVMILCFQFILLAIIGEYIGKIFMRQNGKPQFVIKKTVLNNDRK